MAEHDALLRAQGRYDAMIVAQRKKDEEIHRLEENDARAEAPLVEGLRKAGIPVGSVWDLVNATNSYAQSLPILLDHLQRPYPDAVREGIARAIAVPEAKFAWPILVRLFKEVPERRTKDGLAVAISNVADDELLDELIGLIRDPRHGASRLLLLNALERSRLPGARQALMELGADPELHKEVQRILRRLKRRPKR